MAHFHFIIFFYHLQILWEFFCGMSRKLHFQQMKSFILPRDFDTKLNESAPKLLDSPNTKKCFRKEKQEEKFRYSAWRCQSLQISLSTCHKKKLKPCGVTRRIPFRVILRKPYLVQGLSASIMSSRRGKTAMRQVWKVVFWAFFCWTRETNYGGALYKINQTLK